MILRLADAVAYAQGNHGPIQVFEIVYEIPALSLRLSPESGPNGDWTISG